MYQFYLDEDLQVGNTYQLDQQQTHHAKNVLRLHHETVRVVANGKAYFADGYVDKQSFCVQIQEEDTSPKELSHQITLAIALIRREKFEFVLQKATELGVSQIIPFVSSRCVVQERKDKQERQKERWHTIVKEASAQCKRNRIPSVTDIQTVKDLINLDIQQKYIAYENEANTSPLLGDAIKKENSIIVIGPEGGFTKEEIEQFSANNYQMVSLGHRILRAETAALYAMSLFSSNFERNEL